MGNALQSHESLQHVRGWSKDQISTSIETLRRKLCVFRLTKEDFSRYFGGRNRETLTLFGELDTDADGLVDVFEVFTALTLWSGTSWDDKQVILFGLFDLMGKGFLKIDELMLMGSVMIRTLEKFMAFDDTRYDTASLQKLAQGAMPPHETQLSLEQFQLWYRQCEPLEELRGFIEDHAARQAPDSVTSRMRSRIAYVEDFSSKLFDRIERLQDQLPNFSDACAEYVSAWGRRKRWDFLMQNLRQLILKLHQVSESMHVAYIDLETSLNEDEASGGMATLIAPHKRFKQEQTIKDLDRMRTESLTDYWEATDLVQRLIELTEPSEMQASFRDDDQGLEAIDEGDDEEGMMDMSPPRVVESRKTMKRIHADMVADTKDGGPFQKRSLQPTGGAPAGGAPAGGAQGAGEAAATVARGLAAARDFDATQAPGAAPAPPGGDQVLVAVAEFEPPPSHQSQMLRLSVGDEVTVVGQDMRGWWYGKKDNGKEGWFPPSYVQLQPAHFSCSGQRKP